jgi:hypothetical protein
MKGVSIGASGIPMTAPAKKTKVAASGYIPNFATDMAVGQAMENTGARQHGYTAGKAKKTTIHDGNGKSFKSFVNNKEDVKTFTNAAGKKATIVRPPNGFGENTQYAAGGYIPNFALAAQKELFKTKAFRVDSLSQGGRFKNYDKADPFDTFASEIEVIRQKKNIEKYSSRAVKIARSILPKFWKKSGTDQKPIKEVNFDFTEREFEKYYKAGVDKSAIRGLNSSIINSDPKNERNDFANIVGRIQGILGEIDAAKLLKTKITSGNAGFDLIGGEEVKTKRVQRASGLVRKLATEYLAKNNIAQGDIDNKSTRSLKVVMPIGSRIDKNSASGFIPNFASMGSQFKAMYGGGTTMRTVNKEKAAKKKNLDIEKLDLSDEYTMVHGGNKGLDPADVSLEIGNKLFDARIQTAGLNLGGTNLQKYGIKGVVGDALVGATNNIIKTFGGKEQITDASSLDNAGSVGSAAGTVFETALRKAFNAPAVSQTQRIDFPAPTPELKKFFHNAPGQY